MKTILLQISENSDFTSEVSQTDKDHVHMRIDYIPKLAMSSIVNRIKAVSSHPIWKLHHHYLQTHFWKERTFWSDDYCVGSIGEDPPNTIRPYIQNQG